MPTTTKRRLTRAERKAETRRRLLEAAGLVFRRRGFKGASVEEICAEAGFTRGAFYSNFKTKEQMFIELLQERVYEDYREMLERVPGDMSPSEQLRWGAREVMERQRREEARWLFELWLELLAHAARNPEFASAAAGFWRGNRAMVAENLRRLYEARGLEPPIETEHIATALTALDIGLAVQHLVDPDEVPLEIYEPLYELLFAPIYRPLEGLED
jgi:AcrR family transcriptional regulator